MKKIQLLLAAIAVVAASVGVFATKINDLTITYFKDLDNGNTRCDVSLPRPCDPGEDDQCTFSESGTVYNIYKIDDTTSEGCVPFFREL